MHRKSVQTIFILFLFAAFAFGSGFSIYEQGAKSMAMCGAFAAQANDVTAVFYNPAGLTNLSGVNINLGTTLIFPKASFTGPTDVDPLLYSTPEDQVFFPSTFYASYQINEDFTAGFGFFTPFGLGTNWGEEWVGKHLATESEVHTFFLNPVIAYKVTDGLSVAAGVEFVWANITLNRQAYFTPREVWGAVELKGDVTAAWGYNFGLQYKPTEKLALGVNYRSNVELDIDGTATFDFPTSVNPIINAEIGSLFPVSKGDAKIELPTFLSVGVAYDVMEELTVEADWLQIGWSSYDKLAVDFENETAAVTDISSDKDWEDVYSIRLGAEYRLNESLAFRVGYMQDNSPIPDETMDPMLPGADRDLFSFGVGYTMDNFTIDGAYMILYQDDRKITSSDIDFNGEYKSVASLFGISFGYSFK
jgi:long-chain fatty acid transport protein